jgi:hypothetical protein
LNQRMRDKVPSHHLPLMVRTHKKVAVYEPISLVIQRNHLVKTATYRDMRGQTST